MDNSRFFANTACPYYPCHQGVEEFSCMFCYCPLYALGTACGGAFVMLENGVKDCSRCTFPHQRENYAAVMAKYPLILKLLQQNGQLEER